MAKSQNPSVLIIEDDTSISDILKYNLERDGYQVVACADGREGVRQARQILPDVVILDLMLPTIDGVEVCRQLRADPTTKQVGILMLTAKSEEIDQIVGFSVGADDYVTKPFSVKVTMQRVRALLNRRRQIEEEHDKFEMHGILLDRTGHQVKADGILVPLTPTEFRLLETLMRQPGRAFTRNDLLSSVIGDEIIVLERTIDVHVRSLRQKLGDHARAVETVRGVGYRFARDLPPPEAKEST